MIQIPYTKNNSDAIVAYFTETIGGCRNKLTSYPMETNGYVVDRIGSGELRGFHGLTGYGVAKELHWAIALGGSCVYVETSPESYETMLLLQLGYI